MLTSCPSCGTVYRRGTDENDDLWRSLCPCERKLKCGRCRQGAFYALTQEKKVNYRCVEHAGIKEAPPQTGRKGGKGPEAYAVKEPPAPSAPKKVKPAPVKDPLPDTRLPETIKFLYDHHTYRVRCECGDVHRFCDRVPLPRFDDSESVPRMCCPKCRGGYPEVKYEEVKESTK